MSRQTATDRDERRFDRGAWLTLLIAIGLTVVTLSQVFWGFAIPTDGWWSQATTVGNGQELPRLLLNLSGQPSPLREGDLVLAVNGQRHGDYLLNFGPVVEPGQPLVYLLERDGQVQEVTVPLVTRQPAGILLANIYRWRQNPLQIVATFLFFAFGAFVFLKRPGSHGARYLFLVGTFFLSTLWTFPYQTLVTSHFPPPLLFTSTFLGGSWAYLFLPWLILLVLVFPRHIGPMRRYPRLFPLLIVGIPAAIVLAAMLPFVLSGDLGDLDLVNTVVAWTVIALMLVLLVTLVAGLIHNSRTVSDPLHRGQLRWLALGMVLGIGGMTVAVLISIGLTLTGIASSGDSTALTAIGFTSLLLLPLCLGVGIMRYRLFDIDVIIRKTTSYAILTALLALVYFGSIVVLQRLLSPLTGESDAAIVLSTLLIAALFLPLRRRVHDAIDRRFFRKKYDAEQVLARFAATARDETDLDALTAELLRVIQETMEPEFVTIYLKVSDR
jgi:hypothetical protein